MLANIERWVNTSELDTLFDALRDEDGDGFHSCVIAACDDDQLLTFAKNRNSTKRQFFASGLVERLVFDLYAPHHLPYEYSRFAGMMSLDNYKAAELKRMENVYNRCLVVEAMRHSEQDEISNLGNMILDYRHDRRHPEVSTAKLLQLLNYQIEISFRTGVTSWTMRSCKSCNDGFRSWLASGVEFEKDRCPFCVLRISYPQKTGRNAGRL
jgi:hypothetical protein